MQNYEVFLKLVSFFMTVSRFTLTVEFIYREVTLNLQVLYGISPHLDSDSLNTDMKEVWSALRLRFISIVSPQYVKHKTFYRTDHSIE